MPSPIPVSSAGAKPGAYTGPAILAGSYRIFFLSAALWAVTALVLWIYYLSGGGVDFDGQVPMLSWHAHELIYGYGGAVVVGFAFTAIPNWTGRTPVRGAELLVLFALWLLARIQAVQLLFGADTEFWRSIAEGAFYAVFVLLAAREIIMGKNWRNMKIIVFFAALFLAAVAANLARLGNIELAIPGWQAGLFVLLILIMVIGGRIIPAFTRNWMKGQGIDAEPVMFGKFDALAILAAVAALITYAAGVTVALLAGLLGAVALLHFIRLWRWKGWLCTSSPIVFVLHVSYLWVPLGFLLLALAAFGDVSEMAALHAWAVGGIGSTTLAVMTRASLGHSGQPLADSAALNFIYLSINLAAFSRILAILWDTQHFAIINFSGLLWCTAFLIFAARFGPLFMRR
jgi:uncharacterized protein involved in response to NO